MSVKFGMTPAPFLRSKRTTKQIMVEFFLAVVAVWVAGIVYNFTIGAEFGVKALLMGVVALVVTLICDVVVALTKYKPSGEKFGFGEFVKFALEFSVNSFSYITALIFVLTIPVGTPYYVVIFGSVFATLIGKYVFGGFGYNIFNPAAAARIFVAISFGSQLTYIDSTGATISATPLTNLAGDWFANKLPEGIDSIKTLLVGNHAGALGETFTALLLVIGIVLAVRKVIDWRIPVVYVGTIGLCAALTAVFHDLNVLEYVLVQVSLGGVMIGAVLMLTDPVTSPNSRFGKVIYAIAAALITFLIRIQGAYPEGVIFSIAIMNMLTPLIDKMIAGRTTSSIGKKYAVVGGLLAATLLINVGIPLIPAKEANCPEPSLPSVSAPVRWYKEVVDLGENKYEVTTLIAMGGAIKLEITIDPAAELIKSVDVISHSESNDFDHGYYGGPLLNGTDFDKLDSSVDKDRAQAFYEKYINIKEEGLPFSAFDGIEPKGSIAETAGMGATVTADPVIRAIKGLIEYVKAGA